MASAIPAASGLRPTTVTPSSPRELTDITTRASAANNRGAGWPGRPPFAGRRRQVCAREKGLCIAYTPARCEGAPPAVRNVRRRVPVGTSGDALLRTSAHKALGIS